MIFKFLANNLAIMLAMGLFYGLLIRKKPHHPIFFWQIICGIFFGFAAVVTMQNSYVLRPGAIFDCRSVILSVTGMFAGPIPALISASIASAYRIWQGGVGALTGVLVIIATAGVGVIFYYLRQSRPCLTKPPYLYAFGVLVHGVMLLLMFTFPWVIAIQIFKTISLPVLILFPIGTALLGKVFADQESWFNAEESVKKYNQNLQDSELRLKLAVQSGNVGLYDWNVQTHEIFYSPQWKHQLGYDDHEILDTFEEWEKRLHPEDLEKTLETVRACLNSPPPADYQAEFRLRHKDGSYRWIMTRGGVIYDASQKPLRLLGAHIDVTKRKQTEEIIRQAEESWRTTFDAINDSICLLDPEWKVIRHNRMTEILLGKSAEEITGRHCFELVHGTRKPIPECPILKLQQSKHRESTTLQLGERWIEVTADPVLDENHQVVQIVHVIQDITEQKKIEKELKESEEHLKLKLDSILLPDVDIDTTEIEVFLNTPAIQSVMENFSNVTGLCTAILDLKGNVLVATGWQDICTKFHRVNPESAKNYTLSDLFLTQNIKPGEFATYKCYNQMWDMATPLYVGGKHVGNVYTGQFFYEDEVIDVEKLIKQADQYGFEKDTYLSALERVPRVSREKAENVMQFMIKFAEMISRLSYSNLKLAKSMTSQKKTEQQLRASNQQLQASEKQLNSLMRSLESKNKELQDIVYVSSHDLKSPLININGFGGMLAMHCNELKQLLDTGNLDENTKSKVLPLIEKDIPEDIEFITQGVAKMKMLIDGLLEVSRIGTSTIMKNKIDMNKLIKDIIRNATFKIQKMEAIVTVDDLPDCYANAGQIDQVFSNLLDNALKYSDPSRKPRIHISSQHQNMHTVYCVQDNGVGIHPAYHKKVFEVFHRLNPNDAVEGCGLGLTIIRRIMDIHDGEVWLESSPGDGCKFFISLPNNITQGVSNNSRPSNDK